MIYATSVQKTQIGYGTRTEFDKKETLRIVFLLYSY